MRLKKVLISVLLIFTYTTGIAHNLIPHCHHADAEQTCSDEHEVHDHHQHSEKSHNHSHSSNPSLDHSQSTDHSCEDLFCLIECILSDTDHKDHFAEHLAFRPSETISSKPVKSINPMSGLNDKDICKPILSYPFSRASLSTDKSPTATILFGPNRGPPSVSC